MARPFRNGKRRGGRHSEVTVIRDPGKFEGEVPWTAWLYARVLQGWEDESESYDDGGGSYSLLRGPFNPQPSDPQEGWEYVLNRAERRALRRCAGAIVEETSQGFVIGQLYDTAEELDEAWAEVVAMFDGYHREEGVDDDGT